VSEFVPAILWEEATEAGHVWQRRFYDFVVFGESKRTEKLRYMAGWPTCPRVAFFNVVGIQSACTPKTRAAWRRPCTSPDG
jgi:hypothetical protein